MLAFTAYVAEQKGATPMLPPIPGTYPGTTGPERSLAYYTDGAGLLRFDVGAFWPYVSTGPRPAGTPSTTTDGRRPRSSPWRDELPSDSTPRAGLARHGISATVGTQLWNITGYGFMPNLADGDTHAVSRITQIKESSHKIVCEKEEVAKRMTDGA